jgi:DnaK suppressor protein
MERNMNRQRIEEIARDLSQRRSSLLQDVAESQDEMTAIFEQHDSELEESAQKDNITRLTSRLKERDRQKIREIDAALDRLTVGTYGKCEKCGQNIGIARLRALPTTKLCIGCAAARESKKRPGGAEELSERLPVREREREEE